MAPDSVAPSVRLLIAGGTIAMSGSPARPSPDVIDELRRSAGEHVEAEVLTTLPSVQFTPAEALAVCRRAVEVAASGTPVVVTHGTDLLEEVAFLCDLMYGGEAPIVFTGAMRTASMPDPDGPANLRDAVAVATSPAAMGLGALVGFAGEVHAARFVRKADSTDLDAFESPQGGPIGRVAGGRVQVDRRPARHEPVAVDHLEARVEILTAALGTSPATATAMAGTCAGLVLVVLGAGHAPPELLRAAAEIAKEHPVVAVPRPWRGEILHDAYGFDGAEGDLRASAIACAGSLSAPAARIALMACLGAGMGVAEAREVLARYD